MRYISGITFKDGEEIQNFGSIELDEQSSLNKKYYILKSEYIDKKCSVIGSGCMAYVIDTKRYVLF